MYLADTGLGFLDKGRKQIVSGFIPYKSEIDVSGLLGVLATNGWLTCLPVVVSMEKPLVFRQWRPGEETEPGKWGIPVPLESVRTVEPDVLLVPLLAFDDAGYRLGYGGGFYDRTISELRARKEITTIGVAYSAQQITKVPRDHFDQKLDWILTEKGPFKCD